MVLLDVEAATKELQAKSIEQIERATALTWGGRAAAAFRLATSSPDADPKRKWLMDAENYRQEALEHAAMTEDFDFLKELARALDADRAAALGAVREG